MSNNKIRWERWVDPIGDEAQTDLHHISNEIEDNEEATALLRENRAKYPFPILLSPLGLLPLHEFNRPSSLFNFWMGHTNFNLTRSVAKQIENVPGVETLDIFSRYRFRIGIGKCFAAPIVRSTISNLFCSNTLGLDPATLKQVKLTRETLKEKSPYYVMMVRPDNEIDSFAGSLEDVTKKYKMFQQLKDTNGGGIIIKKLRGENEPPRASTSDSESIPLG